MNGETDLIVLLRQISPLLNEGEYVFCTIPNIEHPASKQAVCFFREQEAVTLILKKTLADHFQLSYSHIFSWITLTIHSSLEAVGLTSAFSHALSNEGISCNIVAAFFHDHIFVLQKDTSNAMEVLLRFQQV